MGAFRRNDGPPLHWSVRRRWGDVRGRHWCTCKPTRRSVDPAECQGVPFSGLALPFGTPSLLLVQVYRVLISCIHTQRWAHQNAEATAGVSKVCLCVRVYACERACETVCDLCTGDECMSSTSVCSGIKGVMKPTSSKWRRSETRALIQIWLKQRPVCVRPQRLSSSRTQKDSNNTSSAAEHNQQAHNGAVNKEDVSASLFSSQQENGFRVPLRGQ